MRRGSRQSVGQMRIDQADYARDAKKEQAMCAHATCSSSHGLKQGPSGYRGRYGGSMLCEEHYPKVVDRLLASLDEHGCAPWEDGHPSQQTGDNKQDGLETLFD